jgi:hypothetical protein
MVEHFDSGQLVECLIFIIHEITQDPKQLEVDSIQPRVDDIPRVGPDKFEGPFSHFPACSRKDLDVKGIIRLKLEAEDFSFTTYSCVPVNTDSPN